MTRFLMHAFDSRFIDTRVPVPVRHLAFTTPLVREFLTPLDPYIQILEVEACGFPRLPIRDMQLCVDRRQTSPRPYLPGPHAQLSSLSFVARERLLYSSSLYISLYSHICTYR